ncbi:CPBP family intramembrane glutamic endopeptidase [Nonomuraea sp. B10E15]|uniref:CPBP family intramembrane glutamic endopeptidase n=1 Tax=Nonomuraea sp. B10E15 TaxID=3153560 RepID=UPI00325E04FA
MTSPAVTSRGIGRDTHPLLTVLLAQLIYAAGLLAGMLLFRTLGALLAGTQPSPPLIAVFAVLQPVLGHAPIFLLLWAWVRFYERRPFAASLGLTWDGLAWRQHAAGFGLGTAFIAGWLALQAAIGNLRVDDTLVASGTPLAALAYLLPAFYLGRIVMISIEEILYRGWILRSATTRWGTTAGIAISSGAFALFHFAGPLMLISPLHRFTWVLAANLVLWSVLAALLTLMGGSLWAAMAFHATPLWLASLVFVVAAPGQGPPQLAMVLLSQPQASPLLGEPATAGPFTGLPTTVLLALLCGAAFAAYRRRGRRVTPAAG